jgi:DNA-binding protein HU-beta
MNKNELIAAIADDTGKPKADVASILTSLGRAVEGALKARADIVVPGVGKLKTDARAARTARNPATGETIHVPAKTIVKFKVAHDLAIAVNYNIA